MKVVLSGIFYPLAILRYFEAALRRRDDVELYTVGPYTATWIPWAGGMHLPQKYARQPNLPFVSREVPAPLPIDFVEKQLPWQPDLWLQIDAGWHLKGKPQQGKNVIVGTDPHVLSYDVQRTYANIFYCMQAVYMKTGDCYLPYAYDPVWHAPQEQAYKFDVCLLGLHYANRNRLMSALIERGLKICYDLGPVFDEARTLYNQAPIGVNWSSLQDLTARVFELLGMRRLAVVNRVPDLATFFKEDEHLIAFDSVGEALEKILYYCDHPKEGVKIAKAGHKAVQAHSWDARIAEILAGV